MEMKKVGLALIAGILALYGSFPLSVIAIEGDEILEMENEELIAQEDEELLEDEGSIPLVDYMPNYNGGDYYNFNSVFSPLGVLGSVFGTDFDVQDASNDFETRWNNAVSCETSNNAAGCISNPKSQTGSFETGGDVEIRKLVQPTDNMGEYEISIAVRGKKIKETTENKVCAVVVFDKSGSMGNGDKWEKAKQGAIAFSQSLINANSKSYIGLVTFSTTASQTRSLQHQALVDNNFGTAKGGTNLHAGLIEAKKMLNSSTNCSDAKQYIVVVSDGAPSLYDKNGSAYGCGNDDKSCTNYSNGGLTANGSTNCSTNGSCTEGEKPSVVTINYADELKEMGIEIFAIGYETDDTANGILQEVATAGEGHFFAGETSNISTAFDGIATSVNEALAGTNATVEDNLGATVTVANGESTYDIAEITEEWHVHSFTVRIDPSIEGEQETNHGVSLRYDSYDGQTQTVAIDEEDTAVVEWEASECLGIIPVGEQVLTGASKYVQKWENGHLVPNLTDNGNAEWKYVDTIPDGGLESCSWTCGMAGYVASGNTCEAAGYIIKWDVDGVITTEVYSYGELPSFKGSTEKENDVQYTYTFSGWDSEIEEATTDATYTAIYTKELNKYTIKFTDENGNILDEQEIEYGVIPEYRGEIPEKDNDGGIAFTFSRWNPEIKAVEGDVTYTPIYTSSEIKFEVNFNLNEGSLSGGSETQFVVDYNAQIDGLQVKRDGYKFEGRYDNENFQGEAFDFTTNITRDINLYAKWVKDGSNSTGGGYSGRGHSDDGGGSHNAPDEQPEKNTDTPADSETETSQEYDSNSEVSDEEAQQPSISNPKNVDEDNDVKSYTDEEKEAYGYAYDNGITTADSIQDARLDEYITRAEMSKMVSEFAMNELGMVPNLEKDCTNFSESILGYDWELQTYMVTSCQLEIMGLESKTYESLHDFMPDAYVTRAEFGTILSRLMWRNKYERKGKYWYYNHLKALKNNNIITNTNPNVLEYRSWVLQMLYRTSKIIKGN